MDKQELKKLLKPLVKECIQETLLEGGLLSGIIAEVVTGMNRAPVLVEAKRTVVVEEDDAAYEHHLNEKRAQVEQTRQSRIKKLNESFAGKFNGVNPFEGSAPTRLDESESSHATPGSLSGVDPGDPGVDISGLQALVGSRWNKLGTRGK